MFFVGDIIFVAQLLAVCCCFFGGGGKFEVPLLFVQFCFQHNVQQGIAEKRMKKKRLKEYGNDSSVES